jgi:hypothetical protein
VPEYGAVPPAAFTETIAVPLLQLIEVAAAFAVKGEGSLTVTVATLVQPFASVTA